MPGKWENERNRPSRRVDVVDQAPELGDALVVEGQGEAGQVGILGLLHFPLEGGGVGLDAALGEERRGIGVVEALEGGGGQGRGEAQQELRPHPAHRVVAAVETDDLLDRLVEVVGQLEQGQVLFVDHAVEDELGLDVGPPVLPVGAARGVDHDQGHEVGLACVLSRENTRKNRPKIPMSPRVFFPSAFAA